MTPGPLLRRRLPVFETPVFCGLDIVRAEKPLNNR